MIRHFVLFKFKPATPASHFIALKNDFLSMTAIPGVSAISFGETFTTDRNHGFSHVLLVDLASKDALAEYSSHSMHMDIVVKSVRPYCEPNGVLAMDIVD